MWAIRKRRITFIILALLGFISTQAVPGISAQRQDVMPDRALGKTFQISQAGNASQLAQEGLQLYQAGQIESALERWQKAAEIYEQMGDRSQATEIMLSKAAAEQALGYYPQSYKTIVRAMGLDKAAEKRLTLEIDEVSNVLEKDPENKDARGELRGAIAEMTAGTAGVNKARGLRLLGEYFQQTGKLEVSSLVLQDSIRVSGENGEASAALVSLGNTARAIGQKEQAQKNPLEEASLLVMLEEDEPGILKRELNKTLVEAFLIPYEEALASYKQAASLSQSQTRKIQAQLNHLDLLVDVKVGLSRSIASAGETDERVERVRNKLLPQLHAEIDKEVESLLPDIPFQLDSLPASRKTVYSRIKLAQSLKALERETATRAQLLATAATEAEDLGDLQAQSYALGNLGTLYEEKKRWDEAERVTSSALSIASTSAAPEIAYQWQWQLGRILVNKEDREGAIAAYDAAFNTLKSLRKDLAASDRNIKFSFQDSIEPLYRQYVSLLLRSQADQNDLEKARQVLEQLQIAELDDFFGDPCSEVDREVEIDKIDDPAAIIYPIILEDRLEVILKLPLQNLRHYTTRISTEEVEAIVDELRSQINAPPIQPRSPDYLSAAQQLYNWLISPANLDSSEVQTLVFVLDGPLRQIPMAVLHDGEKHLIEKYNLALTLGLKLTAAEPFQQRKIKVLAAGMTKSFPELGFRNDIPAVEDELNRIEETFQPNVEVLAQEEFTQMKLQEQLQRSKFNLVHLATHGKFSSNEEDTFILTGDAELENARINIDQLQKLLEVKGPSRAIELLVLSACNTASGDDRAVLGLAGVAVRAGARSTIATLWAANDPATAELMGNQFYPILKTSGSKAQALRDSQLALLNDPQYNHPYYWAPFILVGNWL
ncbi:MAG: CHAT domain-containing protein [Hormoscilla sp.]